MTKWVIILLLANNPLLAADLSFKANASFATRSSLTVKPTPATERPLAIGPILTTNPSPTTELSPDTELYLAANPSPAHNPPWSKTGHRVVGQVAQKHLAKKAAKAIDRLLEGQSLAEASTYMDEIKADSIYRKYSPWHYVNFPEDKDYGEEPPSEKGDLIVGIEKCLEVLKDADSDKKDKAFYLKLLIHLIGDLHQPMHVGRLEDKGGNDIQVRWFNKGSNLHRVWDTNMIDDYGMSYTELADALPRLSKARIRAIQKGDIYDWVEESQELANEVYGSVEMGEKLYYRYSYVWWDTVEIQLAKGGLRLAKVLNELFE